MAGQVSVGTSQEQEDQLLKHLARRFGVRCEECGSRKISRFIISFQTTWKEDATGTEYGSAGRKQLKFYTLACLESLA